MDIEELKPLIRSILLSLGRSATEREFRRAYTEIEGASFNEILKTYNSSFFQLVSRIPDVCRAHYNFDGEVFMQRVSTEDAAHLDALTIDRRKKKPRRGRPFVRPGSYRPPSYQVPNRVVSSIFTQRRPVYPSFPSTSYNRAPAYRPPVLSSQHQFQSRPPAVNFNRYVQPPIVPQRTSINPRLPPQNLGSERVVYPQPAEAPKANLGQERVVHSPQAPPAVKPQTPPIANLGRERVVYKPSENQVKIFDGSEVRVEKLKTDAAGSAAKSKDEVLEVAKKLNILRLSENDKKENQNPLRTVTCDKATPSSVYDTITNSKAPSSASSRIPPNDLRHILAHNRSRLFGRALEGVMKNQVNEIARKSREEVEESGDEKIPNIPAADDYLQSFITDENFRIPPPEMVENPRFFSIKPLDVSTPTNFTFQFNTEVLTALHEKMKELYESLENQVFYQIKAIKNGMIVVVHQRAKWFRAQVVSVNEEFAYVMPLDCMTLQPKKVAKNNIFYLHKSFSSESQKSAIGRIFGIKPIKDVLVSLSNELLIQYSHSCSATVKKFQNDIYYLNIADKNAKTNLIDTMCKKNLAFYSSQFMEHDDNFLYVSLK